MRRIAERGFVNEGEEPPSVKKTLRPLVEVTLRADLKPLATRLSELGTWLAEDLADLEGALLDAASWRGDAAQRAAAHLLSQRGKRIRPLCVMLAARFGEAPSEAADLRRLKDLATAAELVHAATLLHDDVIDLGEERRGAPTARVIFGNPASVLAGDLLLVEALRLVRSTGEDGLLGDLLDVISSMVSAEALQLERRGSFDADREVYMEVIRGKTAVLFQWAMLAGGSAGNLSPDQLESLGRAGLSLGIAFQMVDDTLDLAESGDETGKDTLLDLREGKLTWPLIIATERDAGLLEALKAVAKEVERESEETDLKADMSGLRQRIVATGCVEATLNQAQEWASVAQEELNHLPDGPAREALLTLVDLAMKGGPAPQESPGS